MADIDRLFAEFVAADLAGDAPDPGSFLERAPAEEREQLDALIDAYYVDAPPRTFAASDFAGSSAERIADALDRSFKGQAGLWPAVLPRLRDRAKLKRGALVMRLTEALGVAGSEDKVAAYYHQMEQGLLPSAGVSSKVLDALGTIVGASSDALRRAGEPLTGESRMELEDRALFARVSTPDSGAPAKAPESPSRSASDNDEVDELFLGG